MRNNLPKAFAYAALPAGAAITSALIALQPTDNITAGVVTGVSTVATLCAFGLGLADWPRTTHRTTSRPFYDYELEGP